MASGFGGTNFACVFLPLKIIFWPICKFDAFLYSIYCFPYTPCKYMLDTTSILMFYLTLIHFYSVSKPPHFHTTLNIDFCEILVGCFSWLFIDILLFDYNESVCTIWLNVPLPKLFELVTFNEWLYPLLYLELTSVALISFAQCVIKWLNRLKACNFECFAISFTQHK